MLTTTRLKLEVPEGTDNVSAYPADAAQSLGILDGSVLVSEGTAALRPTANSVESDHVYRATDTDQYFISDGANWNRFLMFGTSPQTSFVTSGNPSPVSGRIIIASGSNQTVKLPAPTLDAIVSVSTAGVLLTGDAPVTVTTPNGGVIYGLGVPGLGSIKLGARGANVTFQSDGTNWYIVDGQQDTGWVSMVPYMNGNWTATGTPAYTAAMRLIGDRVWMRGGVLNVSGVLQGNNSLILNPPSTFVPAANVGLPVLASAVQTSPPTQNLGVTVQGGASNVSVLCSAGGVAAGASVSFEGLSYAVV